MIRAHRRLDGGGVADLTVRLGFDDRHRRRLAVTTASGERVLIDLPEATQLRDGDRLALEDGRTLAVAAADEDVADVVAPDAATLARLAWHLGNRHTPAAILEGRLRIRRDHVLEAMLAGLGGVVTALAAPFDPEPGAYAGASGHAHHHDASGGHAHPHDDDAHDHTPQHALRAGPELEAAAHREAHHRHHRVVACGDGADSPVAEPPHEAVLSNADERAG